MTTPAERLRAIARTMPTLDAAAAERAAAAQQAQALGAVGAAASRQPLSLAQVGGVAAQAATAQAAPQLAAAAQTQQRTAQLGQAAVAAQAQATEQTQARQALEQGAAQATAARQAQAAVGEADRAQKLQATQAELAQDSRLQALGLEVDRRLSFMTSAQRADLERLGRDVKQELFDKRLQFERDETGRKFTNDRQLWDFNVATARSEEELKSRQQDLVQAAERRAMLLDRAYSVVLQNLEIQHKLAEQRKDHASKQRIGAYIAKLKKQQADAQSKANKRATVMQATASGAAVGTAITPGYGTVIGAGVGFVAGMAAVGGPSEVI